MTQLNTITTNIRLFDVILPSRFFVYDVPTLRSFVYDVPMLNLKMRDNLTVSVHSGAGCSVLPSVGQEIAVRFDAAVSAKVGVYESIPFSVNSGIGVQLSVDGFYNQTSIESVKSGVGVGTAIVGTLNRLRMLSDIENDTLADVNDQMLPDFYYIEI